MVVPEVEQVVEVSGGSRSQVEYRCKWAGCLVQVRVSLTGPLLQVAC